MITVSGSKPGEERAELRDPDPADDLVADEDAADVTGWCGPVVVMSSIAANFGGWSSKTARAATSPTKTWTGAAIAATVNGMRKPSRT